uniref:DNA methyltransferase n=1 Tax=Bombella apis TaxID=1785988 RepID=UPI0024A93B9C
MEENNSTFLLNWLDEWTFRKRENIYEYHQFHKYPATFIPELVDKIINLYSKKGDTVLDIFSGSGTSLLEAMLLERKSIGIELNPLACLISKVKTTPIEGVDFKKEKQSLIDSIKNNKYNIVNFEKIDFWFQEEAIIELSNILGSINSIKHESFKKLALVSLSDIIRYVSFCKHSGFKMHKDQKKLEKKFKKNEIFDLFIDKLNNNINYIIHINNKIKNINATIPLIINYDSRKISDSIKKESIDLII